MSTVTRVFINLALKKSLIAFSKASKKSIITALKLLRNIAPKSNKGPLTKMIGMVETDHPGISLIKYIGQNISVKYQEKLIQNLIINNQFFGEKLRNKAKEREKVQIPGFIVISPSYACNLNCVGCYAGEYGNKYHLEKELVFDIIKQANALGIYFFTISGGEPFAWPHLLEMLEKFSDSYFLIYTNGTLLSDDVCEKLSRLGNGSPAISIEGFEKETTYRRGEGMYDTIIDAMKRLKKYGVFFGASVTHTKANHEAVVDDAFWKSLVDNGVCYTWIFQYIPIGIKPNFDLMPTPQQRKERYDITRKVRATMPMLIADFWNDGSLVNGCMAGGAQYLHINAKGLVEPCVFQHFAVDNIREKSLVEVLRAPFFKAIQKEIPYVENLLRPCMIIDHPEILKEIIEKYGAKETHDGAATIINELYEQLMKNAEEWKTISDEIWKRDFSWKKVPEKGIFTYNESETQTESATETVSS
ncbi:MAG: radical SAM protein [Christensenellales bacterium]|jgi:MoaA/NifB/PqqE/SkfB family radical SAM enzyme